MKERKANYAITLKGLWPVANEQGLGVLLYATSVKLTADGLYLLPSFTADRDYLKLSGMQKASKSWYRIPRDRITSLTITLPV